MLGNAEEVIRFLFEQDREKIWEIKEYKSKRSLNQNAYFYKLIGEIADNLRVSKAEIHLKLLKDYGQSEVISVLSEIDISGYFRYYEEIGKGTVNGKEFTHYRVYKGSSEMNTKEMSILLDGTVKEAEQLGIPTLTEKEIERLFDANSGRRDCK